LEGFGNAGWVKERIVVSLGVEWNDNGFLTTAADERQKCILLSLVNQTVQYPELCAVLECGLVPEDEFRQFKGLRRSMPGRQAVPQYPEETETVSIPDFHWRSIVPDHENQQSKLNRMLSQGGLSACIENLLRVWTDTL
jgi:hypothetical protein